MDQNTVSKEAVASSLREAIRHINRNIYEWRNNHGTQSTFTISYTEVKGLARNWLIRSMRDRIGPADADRLFKGVFLSMDDKNFCVGSISLAWETKGQKLHAMVSSILSHLDYKQLRYSPDDYLMDGVSENKSGFNPSFSLSLDEIRKFTF